MLKKDKGSIHNHKFYSADIFYTDSQFQLWIGRDSQPNKSSAKKVQFVLISHIMSFFFLQYIFQMIKNNNISNTIIYY